MTQEDKDLLSKDLCARLPYGVKVNCNDKVYNFTGIHSFNICVLSDDNEDNAFTTAGIKYVKPYLLPISSMTEEQKEELAHIVVMCGTLASSQLTHMTVDDWLNKNHMDYRGLIPRGLAIDATGKGVY